MYKASISFVVGFLICLVIWIKFGRVQDSPRTPLPNQEPSMVSEIKHFTSDTQEVKKKDETINLSSLEKIKSLPLGSDIDLEVTIKDGRRFFSKGKSFVILYDQMDNHLTRGKRPAIHVTEDCEGWDQVKEHGSLVQRNTRLRVRGFVSEYRNTPQLEAVSVQIIP